MPTMPVQRERKIFIEWVVVEKEESEDLSETGSMSWGWERCPEIHIRTGSSLGVGRHVFLVVCVWCRCCDHNSRNGSER